LIIIEVVNKVHCSEGRVSDDKTAWISYLNPENTILSVVVWENDHLAHWNYDCNPLESEIDRFCTGTHRARNIC
jgi:hypothetical protein